MKVFLKFAFIALLLFSCNSKKKESISIEHSDDLMHSETLSAAIFDRSWTLLKKGQQLADGGSSIDEIIKIFPDSTLVQTNDTSILFFIKGSEPMLIELKSRTHSQNIQANNVSILPQSIQQASVLPNLIFGSNLYFDEDTKADVVGSQRGELARQFKKAVLISPKLVEFGNEDDYYVVASILNKNRNYKENVTIRKNKLTLEDYKDWDKFDIVHLSTHGKTFCKKETIVVNGKLKPTQTEVKVKCRSLINTGIKLDFKNSEEAVKYLNDNEYNGKIIITTKSIVLKSDFFEHFYSNGVKNKIWFFSACEMGRLSDMTDAMKKIHKNGHFLYWTNEVPVDIAKNATQLFYQNLIDKGLQTEEAFEKIPSKFRKDVAAKIEVIYSNGSTEVISGKTNFKVVSTGNSQHGKEVIEMFHPEENRPLYSGDFYPVDGEFGDGQKENIALKARLYGYSMTDFETKKMRVSLKVDDETVVNKVKFLPNNSEGKITVTQIPKTKLGVALSIQNIKIPDLANKTEITLKAYLHFDDTYFSIHSEKVYVRAQGILAVVDDGNEETKFFYDSGRNALRVEMPDSATESYMDGEGYFYFYNTNDGMPFGWLKSKAMAKMFTGSFSFGSVAGNSRVNDETGKFNFPIIAWAQRHRMSDYEKNSNFKKERIDCDNNKKCTKFLGVSGQEKDHYAIFNGSGKLIEMGQNSLNIKFKYGEYEVKLPEAEEMSFNYPGL